jgi:hypothetical protein
MAIDSYVVFIPYTGSPLLSESQVDMSKNNEELASDLKSYASASQLFEVEDYSFDIEQVLNIGSQSSGGGSGKVSFNPFSVDGTRRGHGFGPGTLDSFVGISLKP